MLDVAVVSSTLQAVHDVAEEVGLIALICTAERPPHVAVASGEAVYRITPTSDGLRVALAVGEGVSTFATFPTPERAIGGVLDHLHGL